MNPREPLYMLIDVTWAITCKTETKIAPFDTLVYRFNNCIENVAETSTGVYFWITRRVYFIAVVLNISEPLHYQIPNNFDLIKPSYISHPNKLWYPLCLYLTRESCTSLELSQFQKMFFRPSTSLAGNGAPSPVIYSWPSANEETYRYQ